MKIALFASAFHPSLGGVEELVRQLARALQNRGHDVIVLTNRWPRDLPAFEQFEGIALHRLRFRQPASSFKSKLNFALTHRSIEGEVAAILRRHGSELVHVQCVAANAFYALGAARQLRLPFVVTTQGERTMDAAQIYQKSAWLREVMRQNLAAASHITACSGDTLRDIEGFFGEPFGERASVIPNGIRLADFADFAPFSHPRPYILGIGRLVPQKGFDGLLRAFGRAKLSEIDLVLAGDGPEKAALEALSGALGLSHRVRFLGRADRALATALFQNCLFFVLPSRMEPQGIVNLEAMAAGRAVAASRVGGVPETVLDGQTGLFFSPEDEAEMAEVLERLAGDTDLRERLGAAGKRRARGFDWEKIAEKYEAIYRRVGSFS